MKCLFPIYPESWICPQPLVPVCVIAIHHLSYENACGINPNLNQRFPSNCLLFVRRENANAPANKGILFSAGLCLHLIYSFFTHSCYTNNLTVPCMRVCVIRQRHGEPYVSPFNTLEPQTKHVFGQDLGFDGDGCTVLPVCSWIKSRWHRGRRLQTYLSNRDLIHACTESHCGIRDSRPPPIPSLPPLPLLLCHADSIACATMCYPLQMKN